MKTVIVVESPAKARKISSFFKDGTIVTSSFGHIVDLPKEQISIDIKDNFKPTYKTMSGKSKVVNTLRNYNKGYRVLLAADDDREGDAIAWHCGRTMNLDFNEARSCSGWRIVIGNMVCSIIYFSNKPLLILILQILIRILFNSAAYSV